MKKYIVSGLFVLLAGCASTETEKQSASNNEELVCEYRAKTGSNLKKKTCMTKTLAKELYEQNKQDLRDAMRKGQTQTSGL
ncbi:hypothetical protein HWQ46_10695 [Shewanella sp. D64]|uniref:hypothetical protein n=1 Tax=unclassified Shewanella TaxID=196818 RepID=UPI0022BA19CB|nr:MULTISPECIES: hypothetical protein [unclassified Shewanella]MEC4726015.1 hypothetical protein [Shewanella sp. D64]MEC4737270.1 hypothetical protein [Shewanella sp. E94]WBJ93647.1 hypothetical protein HWQ47_17145 [Shewanella sp. MTB7]